MTGFGGEGDTLTRERTAPVEPGDHERLAHYVPKAQLAQAMVEGTPCKALCGKMWVPTRDGLKFPVCPECKEIHDSLPPGD